SHQRYRNDSDDDAERSQGGSRLVSAHLSGRDSPAFAELVEKALHLEFWGAQAPRLLAIAPSRLRTFLLELISARRRNPQATAPALPRLRLPNAVIVRLARPPH